MNLTTRGDGGVGGDVRDGERTGGGKEEMEERGRGQKCNMDGHTTPPTFASLFLSPPAVPLLPLTTLSLFCHHPPHLPLTPINTYPPSLTLPSILTETPPPLYLTLA